MRCYRKILRISYKDQVTNEESPYQDPPGNQTTQRPFHCKEMQTAVVWSRLPFIRSGQNHLARHSERGKKTRQTGEEVGRQHQGMDRPGVRQVPENMGKWRKLVAKLSVVPQRPPRLRDRWWWWWSPASVSHRHNYAISTLSFWLVVISLSSCHNEPYFHLQVSY